MASWIRVNFHKRNILGFNIDLGFLEAASDFLYCSIARLLFNLLGIPIGINPRRRSFGVPVLEKIHCRVSSWKSKFICF